MKISVCITVLNAEKIIVPLLDSLQLQTKKADEIVVVDGGSSDKTVELLKHFQKKDKRIKLLFESCLRARGRNLAVEIAKNEVIAMTDTGCVPHKDWLEKITSPLIHPEIDIVAGVYGMVGETPKQKALGVFLGFPLSKFDRDFLPTARSIAFRKEAWEKAGEFPERGENSAEDTEFNYNAVSRGLKYSRVKDAVVEWGIPDSLDEGLKTMRDYAMWDAKHGIWLSTKHKFPSHNIKVIFIFLRYLTGTLLVILGFRIYTFFLATLVGFVIYLFWAYRKVYLEFRDFRVAIWGPIIQVSSDFSVMSGFAAGVMQKMR